jgi:hypothetical protein
VGGGSAGASTAAGPSTATASRPGRGSSTVPPVVPGITVPSLPSLPSLAPVGSVTQALTNPLQGPG